MAQESQNILPQFINTDSAFERLDENESFYIKDLENNLNANPDPFHAYTLSTVPYASRISLNFTTRLP